MCETADQVKFDDLEMQGPVNQKAYPNRPIRRGRNKVKVRQNIYNQALEV
jgi:hypothetical protein